MHKRYLAAASALAVGAVLTISPSTAGAAGVKAVTRGVIDRHAQPSATAAAGGVDSWVVDPTWAELQPHAGDPITPDNAIDRAVAAARAYNADHPDKTVRLKLRVRAGVDAPPFAKRIGGAPLSLQDCSSSNCTPHTVGRWWTQGYAAAYNALLAKLGARYDPTPEIGDVVLCESAVVYCDGTKLMGHRNVAQTYLDAGYTEAADIAAQKQAIRGFATAFPRTRGELAQFHFQYVSSTDTTDDGGTCPAGHLCTKFADNFELMSYQEKVLGPDRTVLGNNSLDMHRTTDSHYTPLFDRMARDAAAGKATVAFQTATLPKIEAKGHNLCQVLDYAANVAHASSVELPSGYLHATGCPLTGPEPSIEFYDQELQHNRYPR